MSYFSRLNYSLANEDTRVEAELLPEKARAVFAISGSGARVLPLLARQPQELDVIDMAQEQLYLCELRVEAARALSYPEFLFFLGYRGALPGGKPQGDDRVELFQRLKLSKECRAFWTEHQAHWAPRGWILLGKWESHFQKLGKILRNGLRLNAAPIFEAQSLEEQIELFERHWNGKLFRTFLRFAASEWVFNRFLYKGHFSGAAERKTESRPPWQFLDDEFTRLFRTTLVRKNYFMQILFLGAIRYEEGLPLEAQPEVHQAIHSAGASATKITYRSGDLVKLIREKAYDFISLSDTISYLSDSDAEVILTGLDAKTPSNACVVIRSFLRAPKKMNTQGWKLDEKAGLWAHELDGTGVYQFHIFRKQ